MSLQNAWNALIRRRTASRDASAKRRADRRRKLQIQNLERRELFAGLPALNFGAVSSYWALAGNTASNTVTLDAGQRVLRISGSSASDTASVTRSGDNLVVTLQQGATTQRQSFRADSVSTIAFFGRDGDDRFTNSTNLPSVAFGGAGNDVLNGGSGVDLLLGGAGDDALDGGVGNDFLDGQTGLDTVAGGWGADTYRIDPNAPDRLLEVSNEDTPFSLRLLTPTGEALRPSNLQAGACGVVAQPDGTLIITPRTNYFGQDSLNFSTTTTAGQLAVSSIGLNIQAVNDRPVLQPLQTRTVEIGTPPLNVALSATDVDSSNLTYSARVLGNTGAAATIAGNILSIALSPGYLGPLQIEVTASDGKASDSQFLNVQVVPRNVAPTDIQLDGNTIRENASDARIGQVTVVDANVGDRHTITVSDARFEIVNGELRITRAAQLDFEQQPTIVLDVTATDQAGASVTRSLTLRVLDVDEAPTDIRLTGDRVRENEPGALVGNLAVLDPDRGEIYSFSVSDPRFEVVNNQLRLRAGVSLDHEAAGTVQLDVVAIRPIPTLSSIQRSFVIQVQDVNEAPVIDAISDRYVPGRETSGPLNSAPVVNVAITAHDVDSTTLTYSAKVLGGIPATTQITGNTLSVTPPAGFHGPLQVEITVTDGQTTAQSLFTIHVQGGVTQIGDTLYIYGTESDDRTYVFRRDDHIDVYFLTDPSASWETATPASYPVAAVTNLVWQGFAGDDWFEMDSASALVLTAHAYGGAGKDDLFGSGELFGGDGDDQLFGRGVLNGGDGDDLLAGYSGSQLLGGNGNDVLQGYGGGNLLNGGTGRNSYSSYNSLGALAQGIDTVLDEGTGGIAFDPSLRQVFVYGTNSTADEASAELVAEQLVITLRIGDKTLSQAFAVADVASIRFDGFGGDDHFTTRTAIRCELYGGEGNDVLIGGSGDDQIYGGRGNNDLRGGAGDDFILAGAANERIDTKAYNSLEGGTGNDRLSVCTNSGRAVLFGGDGADFLDGVGTLFGDAGDDTLTGSGELYGGDGKDVLWGGAGIDLLRGGAGDDELVGLDGHDQLFGDEGADRLFGGLGDDVLHGGDGSDILNADEGTDAIWGEGGDDVIWGWLGADRIFAGDGNDQVYAGGGDDFVSGGNGNDTLLGEDGVDELYGEAGADHLYGGSQLDLLDGGTGGLSLLDGLDTFDANVYVKDKALYIVGTSANDYVSVSQYYRLDKNAEYLDVAFNGFQLSFEVVQVDRINFSGGAGDDVFVTRQDGDPTDPASPSALGVSMPIWADGGENNDTLYGGNAGDTLIGSAGNDRLFGRGGDDTLYGGAQNGARGGEEVDRLSTGAGSDTTPEIHNDRLRTQDWTIGADYLPNNRSFNKEFSAPTGYYVTSYTYVEESSYGYVGLYPVQEVRNSAGLLVGVKYRADLQANPFSTAGLRFHVEWTIARLGVNLVD